MMKPTLLVALLVGVTGITQAEGYLHGQPGTSYNNIGFWSLAVHSILQRFSGLKGG